MRSKGKPLRSCDYMTSIHSAWESSVPDWLLPLSYSITVMPRTSLCIMMIVEGAE
jgi:hypothetical protein